MAAFNPRRFSKPETLRTISRPRLLTFLARFEAFFQDCGLTLPAPGSADELDYGAISDVLMAPGPNPPLELIDALYRINDLTTDEGMNALLDAATDAGIPLEGVDLAPADVALQVWLAAPQLLEQQQARQYAMRPRSFEYFPMVGSVVPDFVPATTERLLALERELDDWFEQKKRERGCRVQMFQGNDLVLFLVRHGDPLRREGHLESGRESSLVYRPVKYDVVGLETTLGELRVNAATVGEKKLYRTAFGKCLFDNPFFFEDSGKYTLEPLRTDGERALDCEGIAGIDWIKLVEIQFLWPGDPSEVVIHRCRNYFELLRKRNIAMPRRPKIIKAGFEVKFTDAKEPRKASVTVPNKTSVGRDDDGDIFARFLEARGFALKKDHDDNEISEAVTAVLEGA